MKTKAQVMGHPLHPMLIVFPSALIPLSLVFDLVYLWRGEALWWTMAFWTLLAGVVGGIVAAVPGLIDYAVIPKDHPGRRTATVHLANGVLVILVGLLALLPRDLGRAPVDAAVWIPIALNVLANVLAGIQGYLGGTLVYHHAIAVHPEHPGEYGEAPPGGALREGGPTRPRPGGGRI